MAWFPYGIVHFTAPFACSAAMYIYAAPGTVAVFAKSFGYMNLLGVTIQIIFPCSPPWYENMYGLAPANYSMSGSPAGLARIDQLFGFDMYTTNFTNSPVVFGAFPSLHAGNAIIEALFMAHCFPRFRPLFIAYCMWLWWATMYLSHHYLVDLVAGSLISAIFFFIARTNFLPRRQPDKSFRWDYDYVEIGEAAGGSHDYDLAEMSGYRNRLSSDEWTVGSSSSISSRSQSPKGEDSQSMWEGETLADGQSDKNSEVSDVHIK
jgi:membrane-associated phospholipid phosphatase